MRTNDLKYLFAYTIPVATLVSITSEGIFTYTTLIYTFFFIPILEFILKDVDSKVQYSKSETENKLSSRFFDILLYLNIPIVFGLLVFGFLCHFFGRFIDYGNSWCCVFFGYFTGNQRH